MKQNLLLFFLIAVGVLILSATDGYSFGGYADCLQFFDCAECHYPGGPGPGDFTFCDACPDDPSCTSPECTVDSECDDGLFCNGAEICEAGTCVNGTPPDCDDGYLCTTDSCDSVTGCTNIPVECPPGEKCDSTDGTCIAYDFSWELYLPAILPENRK